MRYMSVHETIERNGLRHLENAISYASAGKSDYADGSYRKALRNLKKAHELNSVLKVDL